MRYTKRIYIEPGYDKRNPDPSKSYGVGAARIRFVLKHKDKAVHALFYTNWYPPTVPSHIGEEKLQCFDVGYHSPYPMYDSQPCMGKCEYIGKPCYYDGSSVIGDDHNLVGKLITEGEEGVWKYLEEFWEATFGV